MPSISGNTSGGLYERLVSTKPQGMSKYRSMRRDLALFDATDLYAYACPPGLDEPRRASNEELVARAEERVEDWNRNTSERSAAERLCSRAREFFDSDVERSRYDNYLQWCDLTAVFNGLDVRLEPETLTCDSTDVAMELARLTSLLGSGSQANALMESYLATRGIEYQSSPDTSGPGISREALREARERVGSSQMSFTLPESAFEPLVPEPVAAQQPQVQQPRVQQPRVQQPYMQQPQMQPQQSPSYVTPQTVYSAPPSPPPRKSGAGAIIGAIAVVVVLAIAAAVAFCAVTGVIQLPISGSSKSASSASSETTTQRVASNSVKTVPCSSKTIIVPLDASEQPFARYKVTITPINGGSEVNATLSVEGIGGFTIAEFNDPNDKSAGIVSPGSYRLSMTDVETNAECIARIEYSPDNSVAADTLEVVLVQ